jgi:hypothetical protein
MGGGHGAAGSASWCSGTLPITIGWKAAGRCVTPDGKLNQIAVRAQLEFPHDVRAMHVHRLYTDIQRSGYFFITPPQRQ